ncbi:MAG: EAL domain-containing protein [Rhodanobacter sp.]
MRTIKKDLMRGHPRLSGGSFQRRQHGALRLLSDILKLAASAVDEQALLADACCAVLEAGGYRFAAIGLRAKDGPQALHWQIAEGMSATSTVSTFRKADECFIIEATVTAMSSGQPEVVRYRPEGSAGLHALLALPLDVVGESLGVLVMGAAGVAAFSANEILALVEMSLELGLGIKRQRQRAAHSVAEQQLRHSLANFRTILSHQHAAILVICGDDKVRFVNEAFCAQFGFQHAPAELENCSSAVIHAHISRAYLHPERESVRIREIVANNQAVRGDEVLMQDGRVVLRDFSPIVIHGGQQGRMWQQRDITERKMHEARVERLAFYDVVTGLPNRRLLFELLTEARLEAVKEQSLLAVGVLDLDRFKIVNDSIGHGGGDQVLAEASARILCLLREADVLACFGGDEFALVISGLDSPEQFGVISRCILQALRAPFNLMGGDIYLSASIGWTLFPLDDADPEGLVRHADLAMCAAKAEGKDRGVRYKPEMELEQLRLQAMRERFGQALQHSRLQLLFQPIVYIDGLPGLNGVAGMESLLRLDDTDGELIEPIRFMHVLDDPQLARPIGRYVLNEALRCCQSWIQAGVSLPVSINISTRHLLHPEFFADIDAALESYPDVMDVGFGIEVTETGPSMDHARAKLVIEECRQRGIRVGLDDFGTGTASLSHVQHLDIEHIKLDQSFVRDILSNERNMAIAAGVITTARMLAKMVIAEGVETSEQGDLLASLGCHQLQGFSISRPMRAAEVPLWVAGWVPPASWGDLANERQVLLANQPDGR